MPTLSTIKPYDIIPISQDEPDYDLYSGSAIRLVKHYELGYHTLPVVPVDKNGNYSVTMYEAEDGTSVHARVVRVTAELYRVTGIVRVYP